MKVPSPPPNSVNFGVELASGGEGQGEGPGKSTGWFPLTLTLSPRAESISDSKSISGERGLSSQCAVADAIRAEVYCAVPTLLVREIHDDVVAEGFEGGGEFPLVERLGAVSSG